MTRCQPVDGAPVADLSKISVPTLVIGAKYDTMDPAHMEKMSRLVQHGGRYLFCPNGSHLAMYDDQEDLLRRAGIHPGCE